MQIIDTHNHLYLPDFDGDRDAVVGRAADVGVSAILMPNIDSSSVEPMLAAAEKYKGLAFPMIGLHPTSVREDYVSELNTLEKHLAKETFIGIGETGIDMYWDKTRLKEQVDSFRHHLRLAEAKGLPIVIHARESIEIIFEGIEPFGGIVRGVFHAFPGGAAEARRAVELGFMIGIGGVITFRNSRLGEAAVAAGISNIILETDAPYLAPVPYRGKRNEPSYLTLVTEKLSELLSITPDEVAAMTTSNARQLFSI